LDFIQPQLDAISLSADPIVVPVILLQRFLQYFRLRLGQKLVASTFVVERSVVTGA
jgi:hypothetical protein